MLGTDLPERPDHTVYGMHYLDRDPVRTRRYQRDALEVWDIYNTTGDVHPIHFHLVNVQILGRAPFAQDADGNPIGGTFTPSGPWIAPDPNERGYKETVRMNPGEVTRVIMKFDAAARPGGERQRHGTDASRCRRARGPAATSTCGTATSSSTKSTT